MEKGCARQKTAVSRNAASGISGVSALREKAIFRSAAVEYGAVVWNDGEIDIPPETMHANSFVYDEITA